MNRYELRRGVIHRAYAEAIYPTIDPGSVRLVISDGAYGMKKAAWDMVSIDDLPAWYSPHIEAWGRLCMPSASVYLWNTAAGWARLDPVMRAAGWTFRALVTWDKGLGFLAGKCDVEGCRTWPDVTEVCGFYQREPDWSSMVRRAVSACPDTRSSICEMIGIDTRLLQFWEDGERFPSWELWRRAWEVLRGPFGEWSTYHMQTMQTVRCASDADIRADWECFRPPFTLPPGITNVWTHQQVGGAERLKGPDGKALHPCQKPLTFSDRMIRASSKPGELCLEPFGGTLRVAVACERMDEPDARRYVCIEPDEDGRDYIAAVLPSLRLEFQAEGVAGQVGLFGGPTCP